MRTAVLLLLYFSAACTTPQDNPGPQLPVGDDASYSSVLAGDDSAVVDESFASFAPSRDDAGSTDSEDVDEPEVTIEASAPILVDATIPNACPQPPGPGDLAIDELLIESVAGTGDYGEWVEVASQLDCALDLRGLHGECPAGSKVHSFDISDDVWIPPRGTFVVADSGNPAINHQLTNPLVVWAGQPGDVLRNEGGTVTLKVNLTIIDSVTFPKLPLTVGVSMAFPANCLASQRGDWTAWQMSTSAWFPGFAGTPNAPNTDVECP